MLDIKKYQVLIFDCDGTLVDSMPAHWLAWKEVTERHGLDFPEERFYALGGVPSWQIIKMLSDEQGVPVDVMALSHEKEEAYLPYMDQVQPLLPVVLQETSLLITYGMLMQDHKLHKQHQGYVLEPIPLPLQMPMDVLILLKLPLQNLPY